MSAPTSIGPKTSPKWGLVLGGAQCVWDDVKKLEDMVGPWPGVVCAVNDIGSHWPHRIDHWCTLHPEKLGKWMAERRDNKHPEGYVTWTRDNRVRKGKGTPDAPHKTIGSGRGVMQGGASGMLGVNVLIEVGCTHVVLCGVPMSPMPHFDQSTVHPKGKNWPSSQSHFRSWKAAHNLAKLHGRVRSMSGETKKLLGAPDLCWLTDCKAAA